MAYGLRTYDSSGNILLDLSTNTVRHYATIEIPIIQSQQSWSTYLGSDISNTNGYVVIEDIYIFDGGSGTVGGISTSFEVSFVGIGSYTQYPIVYINSSGYLVAYPSTAISAPSERCIVSVYLKG